MSRIAAYTLTLACIVLLSCGDRVDKKKPGLRFRLALELNSSTKLWDASDLFRRKLAEAAPDLNIKEGEIVVDLYDQGMIGTERQLLEACYFGVVEVVQINSSVVTTVQPQFSLLDLPYLFVSEAHVKEVLNGEIGQELLDKLNENRLQGLGFFSAGFRNIFYHKNGDCADTPEGLKGLKIRVMESPIMVNSINAIGLSATPIPFSELYQSLKTGVVDGAENSADIFVSYRYHETGCNCFTLTEHFTNQHIIVANQSWLESLESKYRERILQVSREIVPEFSQIWAEALTSSLAEMRRNGVVVNEVADKSEFINKVQSIPAQFFKENPQVDRDLYQRILDSGKKYLEK